MVPSPRYPNYPQNTVPSDAMYGQFNNILTVTDWIFRNLSVARHAPTYTNMHALWVVGSNNQRQ